MALEVIPTKTVQLASTIPTSARLAAALKPRATPTVSDLAQQIGSISNPSLIHCQEWASPSPGEEFLASRERKPYPPPLFLVMELANRGSINTPVFSLYLNDVRSEGSLLFGGVDEAKYTGEMKGFPISG